MHGKSPTYGRKIDMATRQYIDPDAGKPAEQLLAERARRMKDALNLKQPDRIGMRQRK
jgi:hypothetical protein